MKSNTYRILSHGLVAALMTLFMVLNASAAVQFSPQTKTVTLEPGELQTFFIGLNNQDNQTYDSVILVVGGQSGAWVTPYLSSFAIGPYMNYSIAFDVDIPSGTSEKTYVATFQAADDTWSTLMNLNIKVEKDTPDYYLIESEERYEEEETIRLTESDYEIYIKDISSDEARIYLYDDGGDITDKKWCQEDSDCILNDDVMLKLGRAKENDYVEFEVYSSDEDDEVQTSAVDYYVLGLPDQYQSFQLGDVFCVDDVSYRFTISQITPSMIKIIVNRASGPQSFQCTINRECEIDDLTFTLKEVNNYDFMKGTGVVELIATSPLPHYATNCGGSSGTGNTGTTAQQTTGDLLFTVANGEVAPGRTAHILITDLSYNTVRQGSLLVNANTPEPMDPVSISSDGYTIVEFPLNMKCPIKVTALVQNHAPSAFSPNPCSEKGRTDDLVNYTGGSGDGSQLKVRVASQESGNKIIVGDTAIISAEDAQGNPVSGAQVTIRNPSGIVINQPWTTDSRGQMTMTVEDVGEYTAKAVRAGYGSSQDTKFTSYRKSMAATFSPSEKVNVGEDVTVTIRDSTTDKPMATISLTTSKPTGSKTSMPIKTDTSGQFTFEPDVPGEYTIQANEENYDTLKVKVTADVRKMQTTIYPPVPACGDRLSWTVTDVASGESINPKVLVDGQRTTSEYPLPFQNKKYTLTFELSDYETVTKEVDVICAPASPVLNDKYGKNQEVTFTTNSPMKSPSITCNGISMQTSGYSNIENVQTLTFTTMDVPANCTLTYAGLQQPIRFQTGQGWTLPVVGGDTLNILLLGLIIFLLYRWGLLAKLPVIGPRIGKPGSSGGGNVSWATDTGGSDHPVKRLG